MGSVKVSTYRDRCIVEDALVGFMHRSMNDMFALRDHIKREKTRTDERPDDEYILQKEIDLEEQQKYIARIKFLLNNVVSEGDWYWIKEED